LKQVEQFIDLDSFSFNTNGFLDIPFLTAKSSTLYDALVSFSSLNYQLSISNLIELYPNITSKQTSTLSVGFGIYGLLGPYILKANCLISFSTEIIVFTIYKNYNGWFIFNNNNPLVMS
jgi:hypothetical protein